MLLKETIEHPILIQKIVLEFLLKRLESSRSYQTILKIYKQSKSTGYFIASKFHRKIP